MPSEMQCFVFAYTVLRIPGGKSFFVNLNQSVVRNQVRFVKGDATRKLFGIRLRNKRNALFPDADILVLFVVAKVPLFGE